MAFLIGEYGQVSPTRIDERQDLPPALFFKGTIQHAYLQTIQAARNVK
jgi:hypothetical protein